MSAPRHLKRLAKVLGVYGLARNLYRRASSEVQSGLRADRRLYSQFVSVDDLVFDIGANLGQKTEVFLGLGARVVGVEPNPRCTALLNAEFGENARFSLVSDAIGAEIGTAMLSFVDTSSTASLRSDWAYTELRGETASQVEVNVTTLDKLIDRFGVPSFCKIDVEGFEVEVLKGLSTMPKTLSFEYHLEELNRFHACLDHLLKIGAARANIIPMNKERFVFSDWKEINELRKATDLIPSVGDVFCQR